MNDYCKSAFFGVADVAISATLTILGAAAMGGIGFGISGIFTEHSLDSNATSAIAGLSALAGVVTGKEYALQLSDKFLNETTNPHPKIAKASSLMLLGSVLGITFTALHFTTG